MKQRWGVRASWKIQDEPLSDSSLGAKDYLISFKSFTARSENFGRTSKSQLDARRLHRLIKPTKCLRAVPHGNTGKEWSLAAEILSHRPEQISRSVYGTRIQSIVHHAEISVSIQDPQGREAWFETYIVEHAEPGKLMNYRGDLPLRPILDEFASQMSADLDRIFSCTF